MAADRDARLTDDFVAEVLARTPLVALVSRTVKLKRAGSYWRGKCPIHQGESPNFSVWDAGFKCFSCGAKGNAAGYLMECEGVGFIEAVTRLAADAGMKMPGDVGDDDPTEVARQAGERAARLAAYQRKRDAKAAAERAASIANARRVWDRCVPIEGTLGERYLIEQRGLPRPATGWPAALGWHKGRKALVAALTTSDGAVQCVHRVFLQPDGTNARGDDGEKLKLSLGPMDGAAIRLPGDGDVTAHAEGLETGLAGWVAGFRTLAYAGQVAYRFQPQPGLNVILRDDDPAGSPADLALAEACERWRAAGVRFVVATPWPERRFDKSDFNDTLRAGGVEAVQARIAAAVQQFTTGNCQSPAPPEPLPGPRPLPRATLADAYAYHARTMLDFYRQPSDGEPQPQIAMGGQGGIGKTETVMRFAPEGIKLDQARDRPARQMVLVPEHKVLGKQLVERYRAKGIHAEPLLGRGNPFDRQPDDLCIEPDDVGLSLQAGRGDINKANCGTVEGPHCRSFFVCPWQAVKAHAAAAPVMVGAINHLFHPLPKDVAQGLGRLVVEEDFTSAGVWIFNVTLESFSAASIEQWPVRDKGLRDDQQTRRLIWFAATFADKACSQDGDLTPEALRAVGFRQDDFADAMRMMRRRKVKSAMYPGMPSEERREAAAAEAINGQIGRMVTAISVAAEVFNGTGPGRITVNTEITRTGVVRSITVHTLRKVATWAADLPVILVNNSPQHDVARQFFPNLIERTPAPVAAPFAETRLIVGGFAKYTVERSPKKRHDLNVFLKVEAIGQEKTSFVGFKGSKDEITQGVPGIIARHHNQTAGDDVLKDVSVHTAQDGIRLKRVDLAKQVRAKTGRSPAVAAAEQSTGRVLMWDGSGLDVPVLRYADPDMQAEYEAHLYGSATQAGSARARAVRRTALDPVRTNILGRFAPPGEVFTSVEQWRDVRPGRLGEMVLEGSVDLNARTMTDFHPKLFTSEKSASRSREGFGDAIARVRAWVARDTRPWVLVRWQRPGQGHALQWTICPAEDVDAVRAARAALYGEPVHWQVDPFTPGQPKPRPVPVAEDIPADVGDLQHSWGCPLPDGWDWQPGWDDGEAEEPEWRPDG